MQPRDLRNSYGLLIKTAHNSSVRSYETLYSTVETELVFQHVGRVRGIFMHESISISSELAG